MEVSLKEAQREIDELTRDIKALKGTKAYIECE
jgi:hypothetical protein